MRPLHYQNFDLRLRQGGDGHYLAEVLASPDGETPQAVQVQVNLDDPVLVQGLETLKSYVQPSPLLQALGAWLRNHLLPPPIWSLYRSSLARLPASEGLRLRLRLDPPELAALPWEYCYDPENDNFLALDQRTVIVRYLPLPFSALPLAGSTPVRLLIAISAANDWPKLDVESERERIQAALTEAIADGRVAIDVMEGGVTVEALQDRLRAGYRALHYIGHGTYDAATTSGYLILEREDGSGDAVDSNRLATLLRSTGVGLVVLNACKSATAGFDNAYTGVAQSLVRTGLPAVVAMQLSILDSQAITFSRTFYRSLSDGWPVDAAVTEGRKAMRLQQADLTGHWGIPTLFMRAPDGMIWVGRQAQDPDRTPGNTITISGTVTIGGDIVGGNKTTITGSTQ